MTAIQELLRTDPIAVAGEDLAAHLRSVLVAIRSGAGGGSGTIWSGDGLIVTNHHVVPGDRAEVVFADDRVALGRVVARDPYRDLAALRVDMHDLPSAKAGDSDGVRVGQLVFAIGNPWGQRGALTAGVVLSKGPTTAEHRVPLEEAIRADLRLAPGNSGGPMADAEGRVIGINSMIAGGVAVAVPSRAVEAMLGGDVPGRAFFGIAGRAVPLPPPLAASFGAADAAGLLVTDVDDDGPAATAGLIPGDVLLRAGEAAGYGALARHLQRAQPGRRVALEFLRGFDVRRTDVEPTERS